MKVIDVPIGAKVRWGSWDCFVLAHTNIIRGDNNIPLIAIGFTTESNGVSVGDLGTIYSFWRGNKISFDVFRSLGIKSYIYLQAHDEVSIYFDENQKCKSCNASLAHEENSKQVCKFCEVSETLQ